MKRNYLVWGLKAVASIIMLQTLFFKFSAAEESVYIFSTLGVEPWGRIATGVMELIASILILIPSTTIFGALLAIGIMSGAVLSHFFILGISVRGDGGQLFLYAVLVLLSSAALVYLQRDKLKKFIPITKAG